MCLEGVLLQEVHSLGVKGSSSIKQQQEWSQGTSNPSQNHVSIQLGFFPYTQGTALCSQTRVKISCLLDSQHHGTLALTIQNAMVLQ